MRVLWLCNFMPPMVAEQLHREAGNKEGWVAGLMSVVLSGQRESGIELAVAFPAPEDLEGSLKEATSGTLGKSLDELSGGSPDGFSVGSSGEEKRDNVAEVRLCDGISICMGNLKTDQGALQWYGFRENVVRSHAYQEDLEPQMQSILQDFRPDVVHCFGTEYPHTLAMCRMVPDKSRLLVGIQGLCKKCAEVYFEGIPKKVVRSVTLRDFLRRDTLAGQQKKYAIRGETEQEILSLAGNVTGRTAWDRQYVEDCNPNARYFQMNETLRGTFYEGEWQAENCEPRSIFVSQADYPIKGLHYMLQALPQICASYPGTKVYVAGNSIVNYKSLKDKLKISAYGQYLRKLIRQYRLEGRLVFLGKLTAEQMKERYLKSNLFVCCSTVENSPNSLGEAMLLGVPCISADVGGVSSIFTGGEDGILYEARTGEQDKQNKQHMLSISKNLADAVITMWSEPEKMEQYRKNARNHARFTHDKAKNQERLTEIYAKIAEQNADAVERDQAEESVRTDEPVRTEEQVRTGEPMQVVFVSNYINHHQIPFCNAMYRGLKGAFRFIQTQAMEDERIRMGWQASVDLPYVEYYDRNPERCGRLIRESKVVIFGGTDDESYITIRLSEKNPVLRYSERLYKEGQWKAISPRGLLKKYHDHTRYREQPVYLLCAGAYVPSDFHIIRAYPDKMLQWGYFPETKQYDADRLMADKKPATILWAARFLDWKHPELAVECARALKEKGLDFHMDIVGDGDQRPLVEALLEKYGLIDRVSLRGYCGPDEVRGLMEQADIYLATSDRKEGWGAVINEAMNSGCAVVASHLMGAAPYLIRHGENGFLFRYGQEETLFDLTERLLRDRELCRKLGGNAMQTITREWNAETATARLLQFCVRHGFLEAEDLAEQIGTEGPPATGPCARAEIVSEREIAGGII